MQTGDGLPEKICKSCTEKVNIAYNFKLLCERSDAVLREVGLSIPYNKMDTALEQRLLATSPPLNQTHSDIKLPEATNKSLKQTTPMFLVSSEGVRVLSKSEVQSLDIGLPSNISTEKQLGVVIEEINESNDSIDTTMQIYKNNEILKSKIQIKLEDSELETEDWEEPPENEEAFTYPVKSETFTCIICSESFKDRTKLRAHKKTHPPNMRHQCPHCEKSFSRAYSLQHHIVTHSEYRAHLCPECGKRFHHAGGLQQHLKYHGGVKSHRCQICEKSYYSLYMLREHIRCAHSENRYNNSCNVCGKKFTAKSTLIMHMKIHSGRKDFSCEVCTKTFTRAPYLRMHMRLHTNEPPPRLFKCHYEGCSREFKTKASLELHIRHKHTFERPFSCNLCIKAFTTQQGLNEHLRSHSGAKPEMCLLCNNRFVNKQSLKKHMRLHTGERPYPCPHCGERFLSSSRRTEHIQSKHMERRHQCQCCGKKFHLRRTLIGHMKVHDMEKEKEKIHNIGVEISEVQLIDHLDGKQNVPEAGFEIIL